MQGKDEAWVVLLGTAFRGCPVNVLSGPIQDGRHFTW